MWEIEKCEEDSYRLGNLLSDGWEPFSVTVENRAKERYDHHQYKYVDDRAIINVIWLRRQSD
jgi:hypothetical protein